MVVAVTMIVCMAVAMVWTIDCAKKRLSQPVALFAPQRQANRCSIRFASLPLQPNWALRTKCEQRKLDKKSKKTQNQQVASTHNCPHNTTIHKIEEKTITDCFKFGYLHT